MFYPKDNESILKVPSFIIEKAKENINIAKVEEDNRSREEKRRLQEKRLEKQRLQNEQRSLQKQRWQDEQDRSEKQIQPSEQHHLDKHSAKIIWNINKITYEALDTAINKKYVGGYRRKDGTYVKPHYRRKHK